MQLTSVLLAAVAAMSVSAAPSTTSPDAAAAALGNGPRCHGDMEYDPWKKLCKCDRGDFYDASIRRCRAKEVKEFKYRKCAVGEKLYCARNESRFVEYNPKNPICWDDSSSKVFCAAKTRVKEVFRAEIRKEYEVEHYSAAQRERKEVQRKTCREPRRFNHRAKACECPRNKIWDGKACGFPKIPQPVCKRGQKAYCAKSALLVIQYSVQEKLCEDNGKNYVFCCGEEVEEKKQVGKAKHGKGPKKGKKTKAVPKYEEDEEEDDEEEDEGEEAEEEDEDDEEEEKEKKEPKKPKKTAKKGKKSTNAYKPKTLNAERFAQCAGLWN